MVPKIHAKGSSFKGAALYLLHDKDRADTSERVAWTDVRNLAVDDPEVAWKLMVATAKDQDRLKAEAGVKSTGRKSSKHVLHISLAWHPDQSPNQEAMAKAADQALKAIGAGDRQALIVAHNDETHPHVHLLINRVSPLDGKLLSSSNDRLKLSKWAEAYEREGGHIYCEDRVINNAERERGNYVKGARDLARHIYEAQPAANDNDRRKGVLASERAKDHALAVRGRDQAKRHAAAVQQLETDHQDRKAELKRELVKDIAQARSEALEAFRPRWRELNRFQEAEAKTFEAMERSFFGRAGNIFKVTKASTEDVSDGRTGIISRSFRILTNAGDRKAYFEAAQARARASLERQQDSAAEDAAKPLRERHSGRMDDLREAYASDRAALLKEHNAERDGLKNDWRSRSKERAAAFSALEAALSQEDELTAIFEEAAKNPTRQAKKRQSEDGGLDRFLDDLERHYDKPNNASNDNQYDHDDDFDW